MSNYPSQNSLEHNVVENDENNDNVENNSDNDENNVEFLNEYSDDGDEKNPNNNEENEENEESEYDGDDDDDEIEESELSEEENDEENDEDDDELNEFVLKQLAKLKKKRTKKNQSYIPYLSSFLKLDLKDRIKAITDRDIYDFASLSQAIVNKQINIGKLPRTERWLLENLASGRTKLQDKKNILLDDYRLHTIFRRALNVVRKTINKRKKNDSDAKIVRSQYRKVGAPSSRNPKSKYK